MTTAQRAALRMLDAHERRIGRQLEAGDAGTYTSTWFDGYTTGIHWRTAEGLRRRGLITIDDSFSTYGEPADIYLTDAGRDQARRRR